MASFAMSAPLPLARPRQADRPLPGGERYCAGFGGWAISPAADHGRRIQHKPIRLGKAAFKAGNVLAQAAKLRLRRNMGGHGELSVLSLFY